MKRTITKFLFTVVSSIGLIMTAQAQFSVQLHPSRDNTLIEKPDTNSNGIGTSIFVGKTGSTNSPRRALLHFNVNDSIPSGAIIDSIFLQLAMDQSPDDSLQPITMHRMIANWGEGASDGSGGQGAPALSNDATWNDAFLDSIPWTNPGGDFDSTSEAMIEVGASGTYIIQSTSGLIATVESWLDSSVANYGWVLVGNESQAGTVKRFGSRENTDSTKRPLLTIWYSMPSSILEDSKFTKMIVFPNPAKNFMTVKLPNERVQSAQIYNMMGQLVGIISPEQFSNNALTFSVESLNSGHYVLEITTWNTVFTKIITKAHD